ncbi:hypothetical protein Tco_0489390 [Tanacetum coccineum]
MEWLRMYEKLEKAVGGRNWLDMMIVYFDEYAYKQREFACRMNRLIDEMNEACADRMAKSVAFSETRRAVGLEKGLTAVEGIEAVSALGVSGEGLSAGEMLFETYPTQWKLI